ncbi:MAG: methyltransferase, partial [Armatimonadetes bacterium]|nr:methyltransferase [Armatimonadota bacterium]
SITDETLQILADRAKLLRRETDKALHLNPLCLGLSYVGRLTDFLCLLASDTDYVAELFMLSARRSCLNIDLLWEAVGGNVDIVFLTGLDFGSQRCELMSPDTFRATYLPALKLQYDYIHEHTTWKVFEHSCGSIANIVGDMAEAGLDILNPIQTTAAGMDPAWLKEQYGDQLTFWGGGVETQGVLQFGTPEEVREQVKERIEIFAPGGGFVFNPDHNIQPNTPPENIIAAYEAALEWGRYAS